MRHLTVIFLMCFLGSSTISFAQDEEDSDYLEFNDRRKVVHGVYLGLNVSYGEINGKGNYTGGLKFAYVANQEFEVGLSGTFFASAQSLLGVYGGLHLERILFSKSRVNLSFPLLIGGGSVDSFDLTNLLSGGDGSSAKGGNKALFVVEPGVSMLYNVSRYIQLEATLKYRFSSKFRLPGIDVNRINGISAGLGIKMGIFNMGRNRYKKKI